MVSRNYVPFTIGESTTGVLGEDSAGNPTPGRLLLGKPRRGLKPKTGKRRAAPCVAPAKGTAAKPQADGLIALLPSRTQPPQRGGTSHLVFFVDLWAGAAVFTFQLNHPSTAERSKVPSNISGCGGV